MNNNFKRRYSGGGNSSRGNQFRGRNSNGRNANRYPNVKNTREVIEAIRTMKTKANPKSDIVVDYTVKHTFNDFTISNIIKDNIYRKRYNVPTPIQDQTIPYILENRDVIGIANTGTGKTAAFLIPLLDKALTNRNKKALILVPTRELAVQISDELRGFAHGTNIKWAVCVGGTNSRPQWSDLQRNPQFIIGTPGRIKDFVQQGAIHMQDFTAVVLDEADRMVDIGFIHEIKYFLSLLSPNRQSLFFSATIPPKVNDILRNFVKNPVTVSVKTNDSSDNIKQELVEIIDKKEKINILHKMLIGPGFNKVLIFGRTKRGVQSLTNELVDRGFKAVAIHGNKTQGQRMRAITDFKNKRVKILLATDVASRGIDIDDISHVINFDIPNSIEDYVHRIGRTGRANKVGTAITFVENH